MRHRQWYLKGVRDGLPIALGYFAVALALGIAAAKSGLTPLQATAASLLINASAGEFVGFALIGAATPLGQIALMEAIANARYLLMSFALSQKLPESAPLSQRLLLGFDITDELFGISMAVEGPLDPCYTFGAMSVALPGWALGTLAGALLGDILPGFLMNALAVAIYGMFIAIFVPPMRKDPALAALIPLCFLLSWLFAALPGLAALPEGTRTIILTLGISALAAAFFPAKERL